MFKTLTAGLTALSLTLVPATPVHADSRQDEINRTIISLLAIGAIGLAIKNNADNRSEAKSTAPAQSPRTRQVHSREYDHGQSRAQVTRRADPIPGRCFRRVETRRGDYQGVFAGRCLERRYRDVNTLPRQCAVRMGGADGSRVGYDASCLRDFGYRSDRRWN